mmetsp:Transcript_8194/g.25926  ORF Transcript_8194/g.25926 Transcript_8194/m.25926 type:complete len:216 (+) Transcript_8194:635-1282(+)
MPRRGRLRWDVHGKHDGDGDRGVGHVAAVLVVQPGQLGGKGGRVLRRGRRRARAAPGRFEAVRHHDQARIPKRDCNGHGPRRFDERGAAPDRDGACRWRAAQPRGVPGHFGYRPLHRRPQALGQVRDGGRAQDWRHARRDEVPPGRGPARGRPTHRHGQDDQGEPRAVPRARARPEGDCARDVTDQGERPFANPVRQCCARGLGRKDHRQGGPCV